MLHNIAEKAKGAMGMGSGGEQNVQGQPGQQGTMGQQGLGQQGYQGQPGFQGQGQGVLPSAGGHHQGHHQGAMGQTQGMMGQQQQQPTGFLNQGIDTLQGQAGLPAAGNVAVDQAQARFVGGQQGLQGQQGVLPGSGGR